MRSVCASLAIILGASVLAAGEIERRSDPDTKWTIFTANVGDVSASLAPKAGANLFSIRFKNVEILKQPQQIRDMPGVGFGTPILYPTPNRVRGGKFTFGDKKYAFAPNANGNFIHGLAHSVPWELVGVESNDQGAVFHLRLDFTPGSGLHDLFPHHHTLKLDIRVNASSVRWTYTVDNTAGDTPVPFGFALHPWFLYLGERANTFITIPATHSMESPDLLPTGKLLPLEGNKLDFRKPTSLLGLKCDDVFFGMTSEKPCVVDYRDKGLRLTLASSDDFTHLVFYTPKEPWFCVENQTCSTDAHNLHNQGYRKEAHLLVVPPKKSHSGWVEYRMEMVAR